MHTFNKLYLPRMGSGFGYAVGMGSSDNQHRESVGWLWVLLVLTAGAVVGLGTAAALLSRKDRPLPDDPDAPLFI